MSLPTFWDSLWVRGWPSCLLPQDSASHSASLPHLSLMLLFTGILCALRGDVKMKEDQKQTILNFFPRELLFEHRIQQKKVKIVTKIYFELYMHFCIPFLDQIETTLNVGIVITDQATVQRSCSSQWSKLGFSELIFLLPIRIHKGLN